MLYLFYRILGHIHSFNGTVHFSDVKTCSDPIWLRHFLSAYFRTPFTLKQSYYQSTYISRAELIIMKWKIFAERFFFRIPSCLGQLIPSYKYLVLTILFLINYFLKINTFSAQLLFRKSFFFRISNYSEYVLFRSGAFYGQLLFQKRNLFRGRYFLIQSLFLVVLRNQFHSIYTWKDFP